ncbi:hypothetical protein FBEOM_12970 [Fusarium beomiforme]|uniref:Uncharacterized protein n=1 Tax=Fusarium beomiforme TaxID=44412 RepID=A0A9P5DS11_9HYPO|nr:hypothetical protein FBEOM_12970 [Fusarium beomiforme]
MLATQRLSTSTKTTHYLFFVMSRPRYIKDPRGEDIRSVAEQQNTSVSEQMKNWLRESRKDMPWHNFDLVAVSSTGKPQSNNSNPSHNSATQGSDN